MRWAGGSDCIVPLQGSSEGNVWGGRGKDSVVLWPLLLSLGQKSHWAVGPWANHVTALVLRLLTCKMKMRTICTSQTVVSMIDLSVCLSPQAQTQLPGALLSTGLDTSRTPHKCAWADGSDAQECLEVYNSR